LSVPPISCNSSKSPVELALESAIAKLDRYDLLILDDIAYVTKDQAETSVLFELTEMTVPLHRFNESWNQRLEPLSADAIS
jgi:DNA replication protein DnaC